MKDLGRAGDEKRGPFRTEREEEEGRNELMSLTLSLLASCLSLPL